MKILGVEQLAIPEVAVIRFGRFADDRGYFTETFRRSDFQTHPLVAPFLRGVEFVQTNESFSLPGTVRGLHFQWNPYVGKLIRTARGRMVDLVMDIRRGAPTFGQIIAYDMPSTPAMPYQDWIWVPPGFAHGNFFTEETQIEYYCTGEYNPACEAGISPLAPDLDWSRCDPRLKALFDEIAPTSARVSAKDKAGMTLAAWAADPRGTNFVYRPGGLAAA